MNRTIYLKLSAYLFLMWTSITGSCQLTQSGRRDVSIDDLMRIRKIGRVAASNDGRTVAYLVITPIVAEDSYSIDLVVASFPDTAKRKVLLSIKLPATRTNESSVHEDIGSNLTGGIVFGWLNDRDELLFGVPKQDNTELLKYSLTTDRVSHGLAVEGAVTQLVVIDHQRVRYCTNADRSTPIEPKLSDPAYRYDPATFRFNEKNPWRNTSSTKSDDGKCFESNITTSAARPIPRTEVQTNNPAQFKYSPAENVLGTTNFAGKTYRGSVVMMALSSPDKSRVLYGASIREPETAMEGRAFNKVFFVENENGNHDQKTLFETSDWQEGGITEIFWAHDSQAIYYFRRSLDRTKLISLDIATLRETTVLDTEWGIANDVLSISEDGRYLFAVREKPNVPKQLCRIDLRTGYMVLVDDINREFSAISMPSYRSVKKVSADGHELIGYLFLPVGFHGQSRLPLVVIKGAHYGEFCSGGDGDEFPGLVMANHQYAVLFFMPDTSRSGSSQTGNAAYSLMEFERPLNSLHQLIQDFDKNGWIDATRTGIAGLSYGAELVDHAAGFSPIFAVGAATTGEAEAPANYVVLNENADVLFTKRFGLPFPDARGLAAWQTISASLNAGHSRMPLLFQPPDSEAWYSIAQDVAWRNAGLPVETYVYPDEGHIKIHPMNRYYVLTRNLQWFDFWLLGKEDGRLEFAGQFRRWETMREQWAKKTVVAADKSSIAASDH